FVGAVRQAGDLVAVDGGLGGDRGLVGLAVGLLLSVGDLGVTQHLTRALVQRVDRVDTAGVVASGFALEGSLCPVRLPRAPPFAIAGRIAAVGRCTSCA